MNFTWKFASVLLLSALQMQLAVAGREKKLYCSICKALVDEINYRIRELEQDPSKAATSKVGGVQKTARTEAHLSAMFENICETFQEYGLTQSPDGQLGVVRTKTRTGKDRGVSNIGANENLMNTFKGYCTSVIQENESDMLELFMLKDFPVADLKAELCGRAARACKEEDLGQPVPKKGDLQKKLKAEFQDDKVEEIKAEDEPAATKKKGKTTSKTDEKPAASKKTDKTTSKTDEKPSASKKTDKTTSKTDEKPAASKKTDKTSSKPEEESTGSKKSEKTTSKNDEKPEGPKKTTSKTDEESAASKKTDKTSLKADEKLAGSKKTEKTASETDEESTASKKTDKTTSKTDEESTGTKKTDKTTSKTEEESTASKKTDKTTSKAKSKKEEL